VSTKIRTAIIAVIAACSFATATVAPAVSVAEDNTSQGVAARECQGHREMAQHDIEESVEAVGRGDYDTAAFWSNAASEDLQEANRLCAEATAEGHSRITAVTARGGAIGTVPVQASPVTVVRARPVGSLG
jgi:hypothetical protein